MQSDTRIASRPTCLLRITRFWSVDSESGKTRARVSCDDVPRFDTYTSIARSLITTGEMTLPHGTDSLRHSLVMTETQRNVNESAQIHSIAASLNKNLVRHRLASNWRSAKESRYASRWSYQAIVILRWFKLDYALFLGADLVKAVQATVTSHMAIWAKIHRLLAFRYWSVWN